MASPVQGKKSEAASLLQGSISVASRTVFSKVLVMESTLRHKLAPLYNLVPRLFLGNKVGHYTFCLPLPVLTAPPGSFVLSVFGSEVLSFSCVWPLTPRHSNFVRDIKSKETRSALTPSMRLLCFRGHQLFLLNYLYCNRN